MNFTISTCNRYDATKPKSYNHNKVSHGWQQGGYEWDEDVVRKLFTTEAVSFNVWMPGYKTKDNNVGIYGICFDLDDGNPTAEEIIAIQDKLPFNSVLVSSQNHQQEKISNNGKKQPAIDRIRLMVPFTEPITNEHDRIAVKNWATQLLSTVDGTFMDTHRYFAHCTDKVYNFVDKGNFLDWKKLDGLYDMFEKEASTKEEREESYSFSLEDTVLLPDKTKITLQELYDKGNKTPIYCPVCGEADYRNNETANAAFYPNKDTGNSLIFCSSCDDRKKGHKTKVGYGLYALDRDESYKLQSTLRKALVFVDTRTDKHYSISVEPGMGGQPVVRKLSGRLGANDFCKYHKLMTPKAFPRYRYEVHFEDNTLISHDNGYVNGYYPSQYMSEPIPDGYIAKMPPNIERHMLHVMGDDREIFDHFINVFACHIQNREKTIMTFLWQGDEGTGKDIQFEHIITPIIGEKYCTSDSMDAFAKEFNGQLSRMLWLQINEVSGNFERDTGKNMHMIESLKRAITDARVQMEDKGIDRESGKNICSILMATNRKHGVNIPGSDRRFNVAPWQTQKIHDMKWWPGYKPYIKLLRSELQEFTWYLAQFKIDEDRAARVLDNPARRKLQLFSKTYTENFFDIVKKGNIAGLLEILPQATNAYDDVELDILRNSLSNFYDMHLIPWPLLNHVYEKVMGKGRISAQKFNLLAVQEDLIKERIEYKDFLGEEHRPYAFRVKCMKKPDLSKNGAKVTNNAQPGPRKNSLFSSSEFGLSRGRGE